MNKLKEKGDHATNYFFLQPAHLDPAHTKCMTKYVNVYTFFRKGNISRFTATTQVPDNSQKTETFRNKKTS